MTAGAVSNADIQDFFGAMHSSSYRALRRLDDHGWLQIGKFTKTVRRGRTATRHVLTWSYAVSYYPTPAAAARAVADVRAPLEPLPDIGPYGRIAQIVDRAGYAETVSTLGAGTTVVEMFCKLQKKDESAFGQILGEYCTEQRHALAQRLPATAQPTAGTASPVATATRPASPVPTPTALPAISAPALSFYTQGSHDTCALSGLTTTFPNTAPEIFVGAAFASWRGFHGVVFNWYAPDGSLLFSTSYSATDLGSSVVCAWMSLAGTPAADLPGTWTLHVLVDGQDAASAPFTITEARTPTP